MISQPDSMSSSTPGLARAAEYVRMSTEGQQYSIANQQAAIRQYASERGFTVVRTYADPGKSGLRLAGRHALVQLLSDVQLGVADFGAVLVYDVSRWGRFQDTDESGYYEYLCRRANIRVEYCCEPFDNDGSALTAILKNIKRVMAAEYSREQSERVHRATCRVASLGYFSGGKPGYGVRRMLLGSDGKRKGILAVGEYKAIRGERMILVPGPPDEVRTVRNIFRYFVKGTVSAQYIADLLNRQGKTNSHGREWTSENVRYVLRNQRYVGTHLFNVRSRKLKQGPRLLNAPADWVRVPGAFEPIVSQALFAKAQKVLANRTHKKHTEESLLTRLRYLLEQNGYLSIALINADAQPSVVVYQRKFGGVRKAYARIGYKQPRDRADPDRAEKVRRITATVAEELMDGLRARGATVSRSWPDGRIVVNDELTLAIRAMPFTVDRGHLGWRLYIMRKVRPSLTVALRMNMANDSPLDFFLLPPRITRRCWVYLTSRNETRFARYRFDTLDSLMAAISARAIDS